MCLPKLEAQCYEFIVQHASEVFGNDGVKNLPKEVLLGMIQGDDLDVKEELVFEMLIIWCAANKSVGRSAKEEFAAFLPSVRFGVMSHVFLNEVVRPYTADGMVPYDTFVQALLAQLDECKCKAGAKRALEGDDERNTKRRRGGGFVSWVLGAGLRMRGGELKALKKPCNNNDAMCCVSEKSISWSEERQWVEWTVESTARRYYIGFSERDSAYERLSPWDDLAYSVCLQSKAKLLATARHDKDKDNSSDDSDSDNSSDDDQEEETSKKRSFEKGDRIKIVVTGSVVSYEHNDEVFFTSTFAPVFPLRVHGVFRYKGTVASGVKLCTCSNGA
jgi:hypothetical protein